MAIFDKNRAIGFFVGLTEGGLEFGAELTLRYDRIYQSIPMLGQFVIVELERPDEAVLGRITAISSHGRLASAAGEDVGASAVDQRRSMPEDLRQQFLRYKCSVRLLGLLRETQPGTITFAPSHRRLPHMGSQVMFAEDAVLQTVAGATRPGDPIGYLAFGEFVYAQGTPAAQTLGDMFQVLSPAVTPQFDANAMVARRTCVFARAGFGKSNLLKTLFSRLYEKAVPTISRRGTIVPVGTLVLDPDGEYFWPGSGVNAPPGLCDVPQLRDRVIVLTDREHPEPYYQSFVVGKPRFDLRELSPGLLLPCVLEGDRMSHRGTEAMIRMDLSNWGTLIDLIWAFLQQQIPTVPDAIIQSLCGISGQSAEAVAGGIRNTMLNIVQMLHDPESSMLNIVQQGLRDGRLVIVDLSLMRGRPATALSAVLLRWLFEYNVAENTKPQSTSIPIIALIEEAQKVLEGTSTSTAPFIEWVKEGRKYDLGAVLVTQQPGAIDQEITSQADNMFVFHLLSGGDLRALQQANGHFSNDILASLLNEPIEGQGVFYTTTAPKLTYPIPFRAFDFGTIHARLQPSITATNPPAYATTLVQQFPLKVAPNPNRLPTGSGPDPSVYPNTTEITSVMHELAQRIQADPDTWKEMQRPTFPKFIVNNWLRKTAGKKRNIDKLTNGIITILYGLYGYGWIEEEAHGNSTGKPYQRVKIINRADGLRRLNAGEDPLIPGFDEESTTEPEPTDSKGDPKDRSHNPSFFDDSDDLPF